MTHIHNLSGHRKHLELPDNVLVIESGLKSFSTAGNEALSFPFEALSTYSGKAKLVVVDIPYKEMIGGVGAGYTKDLKEFMAQFGETTIFRVVFSEFKAPVLGERAYMVAYSGSKPSPQPSLPAALSSSLPSIAFHASGTSRRNFLHRGMHQMFDYLNSADHPLPSVESWGDKLPMVERRVGDTLAVGRMSWEDVGALWGFIPDSKDPQDLLSCSPIRALSEFVASCN